ncbi:MAG: tyrosine-type recombinase/integrase [bacterium]
MSTVFIRGDTYYIGVPTRAGVWVKRTTGTRNKSLARAMARMMDDLGPKGKRAWQFLDAVARNSLSVADLYDAFTTGDLDGLQARMQDVDLEPYVEAWLTATGSRVATDTIEHYGLYVRSLLTEGKRFPRTGITHERLVHWLASRSVGRSTKRKYHAAMSSFCEYLKDVGILPRNPMREIKAPSPAPARMRSLEHPDVVRLVDAQAYPYNVLSALLHATGVEVSVALLLKRRDVDLLRREIRARGTKTKTRDRIAKVAEWAWPFVEKHVSLLTPNALLFPGINRWTASDKHRDACKVLEIEDYQLKDSRHTYAVRAIRAGAPFEVVAGQLGHADTTMVVKVYGRFKPTEQEMTQWERVAAIQDAQRAAN